MKDKPLILLVEEDAYLAGIYARKLELEQCQVRVAETLEEAWKQFKKKKPNAVVIDPSIANESGFEFIGELRKLRGCKLLPIVAITELGDRKSVQLGLSKGANDYLIKGHFVPTEAAKKIERIAYARAKRTK